MSKRKMGSKTRYDIIIYNDDTTPYEDVIELFRITLGYERIQAQQCALLIHNNGSYKVKSYKNQEDAEATYEYLVKNGLNAKIKLNKY